MQIQSYITALLASKKWFWVMRKSLLRSSFEFEKSIQHFKQLTAEEYQTSKSFRAIVPDTVPQILLALISAIILQTSNLYLIETYKILGWRELDEGVYATLLATVASIGAVFIALYYTALTTIAVSTFAKTSSGVRSLLSREQVSNVYIRFLAYLTATSIFLLVFRLLGYKEVLISIPIVGLLTCFGVIAFFKLGQRVFLFFDPIQLSNHILSQLYESISLAKSPRSTAFDASFQNHAHKNATDSINSIRDLITICKTEIHLSTKSLNSLTYLVFHFLYLYQNEKNKIPTKSLWFKQDVKYERVYRQNDSHITIAYKTSQFHSSKSEPNHWWVEEILFKDLFSILEFNITSENISGVESFIRSFEENLGDISRQGEASKATYIYSEFIEVVFPLINYLKNEKLKLLLSEYLARIPMIILLEFRNYISELSIRDWTSLLKDLNWYSKSSIYEKDIPQHLLVTFEDLKDRLKFELELEDVQITPIWYLKEIVFHELAEKLRTDIETIYDIESGPINLLLKKLNREKDPLMFGLVISILKEHLNKLYVHREVINNCYANFTLSKNIKGLRWTDLDNKKIDQSLIFLSQVILKNSADLSLILSKDNFDGSIPDFAGRFLHETGEAVFESLIKKDSQLFEELFKKYFEACLLMFEKLRPEPNIPEFRLNYEFRITLGPLADLIDISGYAAVLSELYQDRSIAETVFKSWDEFFNESPQYKTQRQSIVESILFFENHPVHKPHRQMLRWQWASITHNKLKEVLGVDLDQLPYSNKKIEIVHVSPLIRALANSYRINGYSGINVFTAVYLQKEVKKENHQAYDLQKKIEKENAKN